MNKVREEVKRVELALGIEYKNTRTLLKEIKNEMKLDADDYIESTMNFIEENEVYC